MSFKEKYNKTLKLQYGMQCNANISFQSSKCKTSIIGYLSFNKIAIAFGSGGHY